MEKFEKFLEQYIMPVANKLAAQRHLMALRDAFISFMPLLIIGSIFIIIQNFPIPGWEQKQVEWFGQSFPEWIMIPKRVTFDLMSLFIVASIAYRLAQRYKNDAFTVSLLAIASFLVLTPITKTAEVAGKEVTVTNVIALGEWVGSNGLLVAIITGIAVAELFRWFIAKNFVIKMPESVPPAVSKAFSSLIPSFCILLIMLFIRLGFQLTSFGSIHNFILKVIGVPVQAFVANNVFGAIFITIAITSLWFVGINSGSIVNGIIRPFWMPLQTENIEAIAKGHTPPNILTEQFYDLIWMGGAGATIGVIFVLMFLTKSKQYKQLGRLSAAPGIFNINEPIIFGLPIVLNPVMIIPFVISPIVLVLINYYAMYFGIVPKPNGVFLPWTTPPLLQGFLITGSWKGAVLQAFDIFVVMSIWFPFVKAMDKRKVREEKGEM